MTSNSTKSISLTEEKPKTESLTFLNEKGGISREQVVNLDKITIIEEIIKCTICHNILNNPFECETCGALFCESCINNYLQLFKTCPNNCPDYKLSKAKIYTRKILNILILKCINFPKCTYQGSYWDTLEHEPICSFQKRKCMNHPCTYIGCFPDLVNHLMNECEYLLYECCYCKIKVQRNYYEAHIKEHEMFNTFFMSPCSLCNSNTNIRRCLCKQCFCENCIKECNNTKCAKSCYVFNNDMRKTSSIYNISKHPLPLNFEALIYYASVDWVRTGITFDKNIINFQSDENCPLFDVYCILEDLKQFYSQRTGWEGIFNKQVKPLKAGDYMKIILKNGKMKFVVNNIIIGSVKIDMINKKEMYLFVHCRNDNSSAEIVYITEIFT
jgi:hypothetical protein